MRKARSPYNHQCGYSHPEKARACLQDPGHLPAHQRRGWRSCRHVGDCFGLAAGGAGGAGAGVGAGRMGGPLWCNGWADRLLGWGDACMPGCMEAWDWSALTGWGICRGRREERWVYLYKVEHSDWESSSGSIDRQRARQMSCRWFQNTYTFIKLRWFAKQYIWQNMQKRSKL